jgi:hypothetical protein
VNPERGKHEETSSCREQAAAKIWKHHLSNFPYDKLQKHIVRHILTFNSSKLFSQTTW